MMPTENRNVSHGVGHGLARPHAILALADGLFSRKTGFVMAPPWNHNGPTYKGSSKHKRRPGDEVKGTLCPQWSHQTAVSGLGTDMDKHDWINSAASMLFAGSLAHPDGLERRYATRNGIAFEAKPSGDQTWHGYPIPWQSVPSAIVRGWKKTGAVRTKQIRDFWKDDGRIDWALESDG